MRPLHGGYGGEVWHPGAGAVRTRRPWKTKGDFPGSAGPFTDEGQVRCLTPRPTMRLRLTRTRVGSPKIRCERTGRPPRVAKGNGRIRRTILRRYLPAPILPIEPVTDRESRHGDQGKERHRQAFSQEVQRVRKGRRFTGSARRHQREGNGVGPLGQGAAHATSGPDRTHGDRTRRRYQQRKRDGAARGGDRALAGESRRDRGDRQGDACQRDQAHRIRARRRVAHSGRRASGVPRTET